MFNVQQALGSVVKQATARALGPEYAGVEPALRPVKDPRFGDYQANLAMALGKSLGRPPRDVASDILSHIERGEWISRVEVAGPGFINITVSESFLAAAGSAMLQAERLGVEQVAQETVVLDYGSPNCAKEMHIGHLRSAIIGDAIGRVLDFLGHRVIRQNHIGDWGTQFGMLLEHLIEQGWAVEQQRSISDLNELYQEAKKRFDGEPDFMDRARARVVKLQQGDAQSLAIWQALIHESVRHMNQVFGQLGVQLTDADIRSESFYNPRLPGVVSELSRLGLLVESEGANVVFAAGFKDREGEPLPMIVQKSDGGFGYAATDLAAARFRIDELKATRVIYVVDVRQADHFAMLFAVLRSSGWAAPNVKLEHVAFGTILGKDKRPFKTREGGTVRLVEVLNEAQERVLQATLAKQEELGPELAKEVARAVGIGAVKYADLSSDRIKDYVFDWERMLALEGNTAPYLQNAYVRIASIFRKSGVDLDSFEPGAQKIEAPEERALMLQLVQFPQALTAVADSLEPHKLCGYLYELASAYHSFYEKCPVLKAEGETRASRLALSALTGRTLKLGLELLGIQVVERM